MTFGAIASLGINLVLALLLALTLVYLFRLHRAMAAVRDGQGELQAMIGKLGDATERAQTSMHQLRAAAKETAEILRERTHSGRQIADDLGIALAAGERLVARLDNGLAAARNMPERLPAQRDSAATRLKGVR